MISIRVGNLYIYIKKSLTYFFCLKPLKQLGNRSVATDIKSYKISRVKEWAVAPAGSCALQNRVVSLPERQRWCFFNAQRCSLGPRAAWRVASGQFHSAMWRLNDVTADAGGFAINFPEREKVRLDLRLETLIPTQINPHQLKWSTICNFSRHFFLVRLIFFLSLSLQLKSLMKPNAEMLNTVLCCN